MIDKSGYSCPAFLEFNRDYDLERSEMTEDAKQEKGLIELMAEKQAEDEINEILSEYFLNRPEVILEAVKTFLTVATFQKVGSLPKDFWPDNLGASAKSSIILAEMCVDLAWGKVSKKIDIPNEVKEIIEQAYSEIDYFYSIIKSVGIKGVSNREEKWKKTILKRYDDSRKGFRYIKKSYLDDYDLYLVDDTNSKRDFQSILFQKIITDEGFGTIRKDILYEFANHLKR